VGLRAFQAQDMPVVSDMFMRYGGLWLRPAFWAGLPPPPLDLALRTGVLAQGVAYGEKSRTIGGDDFIGVVSIVEYTTRTLTASLDLMYLDWESPRASTSAAILMDAAEELIWRVKSDWPLNRVFCRVAEPMVDTLPLSAHGFTHHGVHPDGCRWRGSLHPVHLLSRSL
jgi:hypothetical protein